MRETLKSKIKQQKLTYRGLSLKVGLGEATVKHIISGQIISPGIDTILKLTKELNCGLEELVFGAEANNNPRHPFNEHLFKEAVAIIDKTIKEESLDNTPEQKALAYLKCYDILLAAKGSSAKERQEAIVRLIK